MWELGSEQGPDNALRAGRAERLSKLVDLLDRGLRDRNRSKLRAGDRKRQRDKMVAERQRHVAGDRRGAAFGVDLAMPLATEQLRSWQGILPTKYQVDGKAWPPLRSQLEEIFVRFRGPNRRP